MSKARSPRAVWSKTVGITARGASVVTGFLDSSPAHLACLSDISFLRYHRRDVHARRTPPRPSPARLQGDGGAAQGPGRRPAREANLARPHPDPGRRADGHVPVGGRQGRGWGFRRPPVDDRAVRGSARQRGRVVAREPGRTDTGTGCGAAVTAFGSPNGPDRARGDWGFADDVRRQLLSRRVVLVHGPIDDELCAATAATLMMLDATGDERIVVRLTGADAPQIGRA